MATTTPTIGLVKPDRTESVSILTINQNMDKIDEAIGGLNESVDDLNESLSSLSGVVGGLINKIYPVGSIYMSVAATNPGTLMQGTTWVRLQDRFLLGAGANNAGTTGGASSVSYKPAGTNTGGAVQNHTLTTAQIPSHNHSFSGSAVNTGNQSAGHTHNYTDYYASTTGLQPLSVGQLAAHSHAQYVTAATGGNRYYADHQGGKTDDPHPGRQGITTGSTGSGEGHSHTGGNTSATRTTTGISANHTHSVTAAGTIGSTGSGQAHSHGFTQPTFNGTQATIQTMPPYLAVYMWKRTA